MVVIKNAYWRRVFMFNKWINEPKYFNQDQGTIIIESGAKTDFFVAPASDYLAHNAPIYAFDVQGDFTLECKVKPDFKAYYDAGAMMFYVDDKAWIKFAFESTDIGHPAVVSVVTDGASDDANGEKVDSPSIWMKLSKKDKVIGLYFSHDAMEWRMVRLFQFDVKNLDNASIGLEAQSPAGLGCTVVFSDIKYTDKAVEDMRKGI